MNKIKFKKPETLVIPDGISTSGEFEALATLKLEDDGTLCLVAIDDNRINSEESEGEEGKEEMEGESEMMEEMPHDSMTYAQAASEGMP